MRVYEIQPDEDCNWCTEKDYHQVLVWLQEAEVGVVITVRVKEMTEEAYAALPEYMGP